MNLLRPVRRGAVAGLVAGALALACVTRAHAGAQIEEPLADAVRTALSAAIAQSAPPPELRFDDIEQRLAYLRWLGAMSERLKKNKSEGHERIEFLQTVWYESRRAGLRSAEKSRRDEIEILLFPHAIQQDRAHHAAPTNDADLFHHQIINSRAGARRL